MHGIVKTRVVGLLLTVSYAVMLAANSVYVGHLVRGISPALLAFGTLVAAGLMFMAIHFASPRTDFRWTPAASADLVRLNIYTATLWLGLFFAVRYIRPSVNGMIVNAGGPIVIALFWRSLRPHVPLLRQERIAAAGVFLSVLLLVGASLSRPGRFEPGAWMGLGFGIAALCASITTLAVVTNKRLMEAGVPIRAILANRYLLAIMAAGLFVAATEAQIEPLKDYAGTAVVLGATFIVLPAFTLQYGLQRCEPSTVMIVLFSIPLLTAVIELLDPQLDVNYTMLAGVVIGVCAAIYGGSARLRGEKKTQEISSNDAETMDEGRARRLA
jgi:drug/metabolite transporter (DMT)-like permease